MEFYVLIFVLYFYTGVIIDKCKLCKTCIGTVFYEVYDIHCSYENLNHFSEVMITYTVFVKD